MKMGHWFLIIHWLMTCMCLSSSQLHFWDLGRNIPVTSLKTRKNPLEGTYYNHSKAKYSMHSLLLENQSPEVNYYILGDSQSL